MKKVKHEIYGMSRIGYVKGEYEVYVNTDDAEKIPHFHFRDKNDCDKFHTCIRIDKPEYFLHEGKEDALNSKMKRDIQKFMTSKPSLSKYIDKFENNWEVVCFMWDANNSDVQISEDIVQPDYTEL